MHSWPFWSVVVPVVWIAVAGAAVWAAVRLIRRPQPKPPALPSPLDILERRYAAGELTHEGFDEARARLREHHIDL
jgi:putative membrane protein